MNVCQLTGLCFVNW